MCTSRWGSLVFLLSLVTVQMVLEVEVLLLSPVVVQVVLEVEVLAYPEPTLQWYFEGVAIPSAASRRLVLPRMQRSHYGLYTCRAFNEAGFADSDPYALLLRSEAPTIIRTSDDCQACIHSAGLCVCACACACACVCRCACTCAFAPGTSTIRTI
jgi:hypothetical protein